jgi:peptidoglycan/LPS O-acetylase OafA/YrhL
MTDNAGKEAQLSSEPGSANASALRGSLPKLHIPILDDCRGIAIFLVFLRHCEAFLPAWWDHALDRPWEFASDVFSGKADLGAVIAYLILFPGHLGWVALPIFFVVSGFCIHLSYCQTSRPSLKAFYVRRFFRIYPAYFVALLVFATVFPWSRLSFTKLTGWAQLGAHVFQFHNFFETSLYAVNASYWTIAIEVQLYLLFPLLLLFARRFSYTWLLVGLGAIEISLHTFSALFCYAPGHFPPAWLRASPFFFCFSWALGAALADAYLSRKPLPFSRVHPAIWLVPAVLTSPIPAHEFSFTFFSLATAGILSRHLSGDPVDERKSILGRFIRRTGLYSYSIYLIHGPIVIALTFLYETAFRGIENNPFLILGAALSTWIVIFPVSALMYNWVEKPGIALGKKVLRTWLRRPVSQLDAGAVPAA